MLRLKDWVCVVLLGAVASFVLISCSSQPAANPAAAPDGPPTQMSSDENMPEGLAKLPEADRAAALRQAVCPVTGDKLGSMGKPPRIAVNGQKVFLCCAGCEEELRKNPEKFLAKVNPE